ncbi:MAG: flavin reductase family protein [Oscillospiraceae bacterium]|jgi:flavin reductase (DIM6/NTAB) family NADH-FMN oxidoreductase RutF|nr:flavin reductase family protein [Oscillospiraceae bacterium]
MKKSLGVRELAFPAPAFVIGTYDDRGEPNGITLAWCGIVSSGPAAIGISVRPGRYSYKSLLERRAFTVNFAPEKRLAETDYFGIVSGRDVNKFEKTGLTAVRGDFVDAPYIKEFPVNIECEVTHTLDLGAHTLFIGEVRDVKADESALDASGRIDIHAAGILTFDVTSGSYLLPGPAAGRAFSAGAKFKE